LRKKEGKCKLEWVSHEPKAEVLMDVMKIKLIG
jgi:hypothetical protein